MSEEGLDSVPVPANGDSNGNPQGEEVNINGEGQVGSNPNQAYEDRIKDLQAGYTKSQQEKAALIEAFTAIKSSFKEQVKEPEDIDPLDESKWSDTEKAEYADVPDSFKKLLRSTRKQMANIIEYGIEEKAKLLAEQIAEATDPTVTPDIRATMEELNNEPWFKSLNKRGQIQAAKKIKGTSNTNSNSNSNRGINPPMTGPQLGRGMKQPTQIDEKKKAINDFIDAKFNTGGKRTNYIFGEPNKK
jgi:hypothetical protein